MKGEGGTFSRLYTKALSCWPVEPAPSPVETLLRALTASALLALPHRTVLSVAKGSAALPSHSWLSLSGIPPALPLFSVPVWPSPLQGVLRLRSEVTSSLLNPRNSSAPPPPWRLCRHSQVHGSP